MGTKFQTAVLTRKETSDEGTFGTLSLGPLVLYTGELPDRDNLPGRSCILPGTYYVRYGYSPSFHRNLYRLDDRNGRTGVLIHPANYMGDTSAGYRCQLLGCIALGEQIGKMDGQRALLVSAPAVLRFQRFMAEAPFTLEIRNEFS